MDNQVLRRQIAEELQAEFEDKLRQVRRQKEQAEGELESASERWRTEKRRMNSEIDRLEAALADAKAAVAKKHSGSETAQKSQGIDAAAVLKLQEAADEKLKKAAVDWDAERKQLKSQITRLEGAVADAIARSSNPMRSTQSVKEQFEVELNRAATEKTELEQAFLRAKTDWEQEKLRMTAEVVKLRRVAQIMGRPVPKEDAPEANPKVRDLENQLQESFTQWGVERELLMAQMHKLEESARHWETERRQLNDHAGQLQQAYVQAQAQIQAYEVSARSSKASESVIDQFRREKDALQKEFQEARNAWNSERGQLNEQIERLNSQIQRLSETKHRVSDEIVEQLRNQYEQKLQEAIQQKIQLAQQLQSASSLLETERSRLSAAHRSAESGLDQKAIKAEVARVEASISEIIAIIDDQETELATIIKKNVEKAELDAYLRGILFVLGRSKGTKA